MRALNLVITAIIISYKRGFYGENWSNGSMIRDTINSGFYTRLQRGEW